jgi:hypothetical protein
LLHTRQFFDFLISHLHQVLLLHTSFFFFFFGWAFFVTSYCSCFPN